MGNYQHNHVTFNLIAESNKDSLRLIIGIAHALELQLPSILAPYFDDFITEAEMDTLSDAFEAIGFSSRMNLDCHPTGCPEVFLTNTITDVSGQWTFCEPHHATNIDANLAFSVALSFSSKDTDLADKMIACIAERLEGHNIRMYLHQKVAFDENTVMTDDYIKNTMKLLLNGGSTQIV